MNPAPQQLNLSVDVHIKYPEIYKKFLDQEQLSPSGLLQEAVEVLMDARINGNDRSLRLLIYQKERAMRTLQTSLLRAMNFIESMGLLDKYGSWIVLNEQEAILKHGIRN